MTDDNGTGFGQGASTDGESTGPRAGWYPDPAGSSRQRWWDGSSWTESLRDAPAAAPTTPPIAPAAATPITPPVAPVPPVPPAAPAERPAYGETSSGTATGYGQTASGQYPQQAAPLPPAPGQQAYGQQSQQPPYQQSYAAAPVAPVQQRDSSIVTATPWIWVVVFLPLLSAVSIFLLPPSAIIDWSMASTYGPRASMSGSTAYLVGMGAVQIVGFLIYAAEVVFAFLDWRQLKRAGMQRPFHWAWGFLAAPYVYVIGRSVIVKRVTGGGLLPLWIFIAVVAVSFIIAIGWTVALVTQMSVAFSSSGF
ncbi:DUF2510 domain-containing protein [Rathayibacter iranicus]|nr:DUF2510 domain-containing protein [Rathayibacter iranicus]PWJ65264.1 uncharacterized protein DUF2510 [Rathayibacter iranicus NCPPB 2253 = VKM Ac-1602]